jgi:hypothetical protein
MPDDFRQFRETLSASQFQALIEGRPVTLVSRPDIEVHVLLADIGFTLMRDLIDVAERDAGRRH